MAAKLPWQAAVVLAGVSFVGLHLLADGFATPAKVSSVADMGAVAVHSWIHIVAYLLQVRRASRIADRGDRFMD